MSSVDDNVAALRAEVARLTGATRIVPLARLGQALTHRFTRHMTTSPSALADLDEAVNAYTEAYDLLDEDDPLRRNVLFSLGFARGVRSTVTNDAADRTASIDNLEAALTVPEHNAMATAGTRMLLGQQYLARAIAPLAASAVNPAALLSGMANPSGAADLDMAVRHFQHVISGPPVSDDFLEAARAFLEVVEPLRAVLCGSGGLDIGKLMASAQALQSMQQRLMHQQPGSGPLGLPSVLSIGDVNTVFDLNPLDYPIAVVRDVEDHPATVVPSRPEPVVPPEPVLRDLRDALRARLSLHGSAVPVWEAAAALLLPEAALPAAAVVDDVVARASTVVDHQDDDTDPEDAAVDWFLLAVTLHLRDRVEGCADGGAGAEALLTAARRAPSDHPAAPVILGALGAFLDRDKPLDGVLERFAAGFAGRLDSVLAGDSVADPRQRAALDALRSLCRAAFARTELRRTVDTVQPEYPWTRTLRTAVASMG